jgi:hypothetical protein
MTFEAGQSVVRRAVHRNGRIAAVETGRVITDDAHGVLTWTGPGSHVMYRSTMTGEPIRKMPMDERRSIPTMLSPAEWRDTGVLMLTPPASAHSVWWFFDLAGTFEGWYVNLETPARRWFGGLDIRDLALDIWVEPDRSWEWKDEDEFAERTGHPDFWSVQEAAEIRAEGERVIALIEAGSAAFDGRLTDFQPDPAWEPTRLPPHWDLPNCP